MVTLPLLYFFYLDNVCAQRFDDSISNIVEESASNISRDYQYYHEALESRKLDTTNDIGWRIWGGDFVSITDVPYIVLYGRGCGGSLIAPNWVLTAAHCQHQYFIYVGSENIHDTQGYAISLHYYHPGWFAQKYHYHDFDFLLLALVDKVPMTPYSMPIALGEYQDLYAGQPVAVSGWGHAKYRYNIWREMAHMSDRLRQVWMTVVDYRYCAAQVLPAYAFKFGEFAAITPRMVCALSDKGGSCFGDSGGPVVANSRLVGVVSWGIHCEPILVFSNVLTARDWIRDITGI